MALPVLKIFPAVVVCFLCLWGCQQQELTPGIVATVNGRPIALRTLQTMQDTRTAGLGAFEKPSLSTLRKQYGTALTTLIAQEMVLQELEGLGIPVSDDAVSEAELRIRQDYPEEGFEKNLAESAIDLMAWRELMRYRIGMSLFSSQVLKPGVVVPLEEVESFYQERQKDFVVPKTMTLYQVIGEDKTKIEAMHKEGDIPEDSADARVYRLNISHASLPPEWEKKVRPLKAGECTQVVATEARYEFVCLMSEAAERRLSITEAYPYIEEVLLEEKLDKAFQGWLEKTLLKTKIKVSAHLLEEMRERDG